jgi:hypothetical protein
MPTVGKKKFNYSPIGRVAAQKESRRTGQPVQNSSGYRGQPGTRSPFPVSKRPFTGYRPQRPGQLQNPGGNFAPPRRPGPGIAPPPSGLRGGRMRKPGSGGARRMGTPSLGRVMTGRKRRV